MIWVPQLRIQRHLLAWNKTGHRNAWIEGSDMAAARGANAALMEGNSAQAGSYVLRDLLKDVPLDPDGGDEAGSVHITCVDAWSKAIGLSVTSIYC